MEKDQYSFCY